jgi:hypothetical protein
MAGMSGMVDDLEVRMPKRLDVERAAEHWSAQLRKHRSVPSATSASRAPTMLAAT